MRAMRCRNYFWLLLCLCACADNSTAPLPSTGMVHIPGGEFVMGTDDAQSYETERPAHRVKVAAFMMDVTEVTNEQFKVFVDATHFVTQAERVPDWEQLKLQLPAGTPKPSQEKLVAGSLVFTPPQAPVSVDDASVWWNWVPGANWRHPEGPESNLDGRWNHPVVQISWD
ncbi:MAG: SUMF1/EgtB/PvdO family nonheme iron enzyme, partial [Phycisphaerae bacterium]